jgi:hypothetical protein
LSKRKKTEKKDERENKDCASPSSRVVRPLLGVLLVSEQGKPLTRASGQLRVNEATLVEQALEVGCR